MIRLKHFLFMVFLLLFAGTAGLSARAEICNRIVAVVNDDVVTLHQLNSKIEEFTGKKPAHLENQDREAYINFRRQILDMLVDENIIRDKAEELGFEVSEKELAMSIEKIKQGNQWTQEDFMAAVQKQGLTFEQFKKKMKQEIEKNRLIDYEVKSRVIINDAAIKEYFDEHNADYQSHAGVQLAVIFLDRRSPDAKENADKIVSQLKQGKSFQVLAKQYSDGPNAEDGGNLGMIQMSQLDPKLKSMVNHMAVGEVSRPIIDASGIKIFKLIEKHDNGTKSLEQVRNEIYDILYNRETETLFTSWIKELREQAYIKITF